VNIRVEERKKKLALAEKILVEHKGHINNSDVLSIMRRELGSIGALKYTDWQAIRKRHGFPMPPQGGFKNGAIEGETEEPAVEEKETRAPAAPDDFPLILRRHLEQLRKTVLVPFGIVEVKLHFADGAWQPAQVSRMVELES